ncbi:MAG: tyrosine-type recombinase/integrase [Bacteroidales bacterium]|nr:tyrosine-type recombinase/integrase [Candidatus Cacconaster merdequi]
MNNKEKHPQISVSALLAHKVESNLKQGRINSYYRYRSALRAFERHTDCSIPAIEVSKGWLERCERSFREQPLSYTTIRIYMNALKAALRDRYPERKLPFGRDRYEIPVAATRKLALTKGQVQRIAEYRGTHKEELYRDLWLFSYLCNGINFRDMLFLKKSDVRDGEICFTRCKTRHRSNQQRIVRAAVTPQMRAIMERYCSYGSSYGDGFIFPFAKRGMSIVEQTYLTRRIIRLCNLSLHNIAGKAGVPQFTTYSARHSFATVLQRSGVSIEYISESLGHSSLEMTRTYLAGFDTRTRMRNARKLL